MTGLAQLSRQNLSTTLARVGPDAPTLCEGWVTRDLAAHLVVRERRPDAVAGGFVPALAERTKSVVDSFTELPWDELVDLVRQGPRGWSPTRVPTVDDAINLTEFFIHHEDVLRADPEWSADRIAEDGDDVQEALWQRLRQIGQLLFRRSPVGVVLRPQGIADKATKAVHGPTKLGTVTLTGLPGEILLFASGRSSVAQVTIDGEADAVQALREAPFTM